MARRVRVTLDLSFPDDWQQSPFVVAGDAAATLAGNIEDFVREPSVVWVEFVFSVQATRYQRGMTPIRPSRPVYGWKIRCTHPTTESHPEFVQRINGTKQEARSQAKDHLRNAHHLTSNFSDYLGF